MKVGEIKEKFKLFCNFMKENVFQYCTNEDAKKLMILYCASYSMLDPYIIANSMRAQFFTSGIPMEIDVLYDRQIKTFQIDEEALPEETKNKMKKWIKFIIEVINELS